MANPELAVSAYLQLAVISHQRSQWLPRNKFLILAADAACREGLLSIAERSRSLVIANSPGHILGRHESFVAAMKSTEFQTYLKQLRKFCSVERAEFLLEGQLEKPQPANEESSNQLLDAIHASD